MKEEYRIGDQSCRLRKHVSCRPIVTDLVVVMWPCVGHLCMECRQIYNTGLRPYVFDSYNLIDFSVLSLYLASYTLRFLVDRWIKTADAHYDGTDRARGGLVERNRTDFDLVVSEIFSDEQQPLHSYFMKACTICRTVSLPINI